MLIAMKKDIITKISILKKEIGQWGKWRRYIYLTYRIFRLNRDMEELAEQYDNAVQSGTATDRHIVKYYLDKSKRRKYRLLRERDMSFIKTHIGDITDEMIRKAKEYPMEALLLTERKGKIKCISGTHEDKHPSMAIWRNRVKCWSCGYKGSTIDVVMRLYGYSFSEAVKYLNEL